MPNRFTGGELAGIITACVGGATALGAFVKWLFGGRKREQIKSLMEQYEFLEKRYNELNAKVDGLYKQVHALEKERLDLMQENNELRLALKEAQHNVCLVPDDECLKRLPKRDQCRLRNILRGEYAKEHPGVQFPDDSNREEGHEAE